MYLLKVINWTDPQYLNYYLKQIIINDEGQNEFEFVLNVEDAIQFKNKKEVNDYIRRFKLNVGVKNFEIEMLVTEDEQ